jgi:hypothetical protein
MSSLRGFGFTFDVATGRVRNWYIDAEGAERWADTDELVTTPPTEEASNG